jgi:hypothetical protein
VDGAGIAHTSPSGEKISVPGSFDATGFTATLDSGREINIKSENLVSMFKVDSKYDLLKVYDENGVISAEYDPGQGDLSSPDYIPGIGWVDIQKLATDLDCMKRPTCFNEVIGQPVNSIWFEFSSTGVFKNIDLVDNQTGTIKGNVLTLQVVSRDVDGKPIVEWMLLQAEDFSRSGYSDFLAVQQSVQRRNGIPNNLDYMHFHLSSIEDWETWIPKNSMWTFALPKSWTFGDWKLLQGTQLATPDHIAERSSFAENKGVGTFNSEIVLIGCGASDRLK